MRNDKANLPAITYISAFLIGVILFRLLGKNWLDLESKLVFLAGIMGVLVAVSIFWVWNANHNRKDKNNKP